MKATREQLKLHSTPVYKARVVQHLTALGYSNVSQYLRALIEADMRNTTAQQEG